MKKVLITMAVFTGLVAGGMVLSSFMAPKPEKTPEITMTVPSDGPGTCIEVGNCTMSINSCNGGYIVSAKNYNWYKVTVNWSAYCSNGWGGQIKAGGGTLCVDGKRDKDYGSASTTFSSTLENVYLDGVNVYKCD